MKRPNRVQSHGTGPTIYDRKYLRNKRGETLEVSTGFKEKAWFGKNEKIRFSITTVFWENFSLFTCLFLKFQYFFFRKNEREKLPSAFGWKE